MAAVARRFSITGILLGSMALARPAFADEAAPPSTLDALAGAEAFATTELASVLVFESYTGGQRFGGIDVRAGFRPWPALLLGARLGVRQGFPVTAPNGTITASAVVLGAEAKLAVTPQRSAAGVELLARGDAVRAAFTAEPSPGARAHPRHDTAFTIAGGLGAWVELNRALRLAGEASAGSALHSVRATDTSSEVLAVGGAVIAVGAGLAYLF